MTPQGQVPADHNDIVAQALAILNKRTGLTANLPDTMRGPGA